jgi:hypothetical protein
MILNLNRVQTCFEFGFPELSVYPFPNSGKYRVNALFGLFSKIIDGLRDRGLSWGDYFIGITSVGLGENLFWDIQNNMVIITTDVWKRLFSPPSVFEYITHSLTGSLVQMSSETEASTTIGSHRETKGCLLDFTLYKRDDKVDISLGYVCDECKSKIKDTLGENFTFCIEKMSSRSWIGEVADAGSVAYNLKKFFKVDLDEDTGFYKTRREKVKEFLLEIPKTAIIVAMSATITAVIAYFITR